MSHIWENLFVLTNDISLLEKILRPILVYVFLIVGLRLAGKRELAQLNPFDLDRVADAIEYGSERDHRQRQQRRRRRHRGHDVAGG